jgi:hypothetical protein
LDVPGTEKWAKSILNGFESLEETCSCICAMLSILQHDTVDKFFLVLVQA